MNQQCINVGILSTAAIAHKVCLSIQASSNCKAYAVASRSLEKAQEWAKAHNITVSYGSYDSLLNDPTVDAVYIPLPTSLKKEWTIKAANHKKHVLVEKPLPGDDSIKDLSEMLQACKVNNVLFMDGTMWLHSNRTQEMAKKLPTIGQIRYVNCSKSYIAPLKEQPNNIRNDITLESTGCFGNLGWYSIAALLYAFQYELPTNVRCIHAHKNENGVLMQFHGVLEYSNNRLGHFDCSFEMPYRDSLEIVGENGVIRLDDFSGGIGRTGNIAAYSSLFTGSSQYFIDDAFGKESVIAVEPSDHTKMMFEQFGNIILSGELDNSWAEKSMKTQQVMTALYTSYLQGNKLIVLQQ